MVSAQKFEISMGSPSSRSLIKFHSMSVSIRLYFTRQVSLPNKLEKFDYTCLFAGFHMLRHLHERLLQLILSILCIPDKKFSY